MIMIIIMIMMIMMILISDHDPCTGLVLQVWMIIMMIMMTLIYQDDHDHVPCKCVHGHSYDAVDKKIPIGENFHSQKVYNIFPMWQFL